MKYAGRLALLLLPLLAGPGLAAQVYRWADAQGRVHYGGVPPAEAGAREVRSPEVTEEQRRDAAALAVRERAELAFREAAEAAARARLPQPAFERPYEPRRLAAYSGYRGLQRVASGPADDPSGAACAAAWRAYRESVDCFARFRIKNGGVRPEAFGVCRQILQPTCNEPALPPQPNAPARTPHD